MNEDMGVYLRRCSFIHTIDTVGNFSLHIQKLIFFANFKNKMYGGWLMTGMENARRDIA